MSAMEKCTFCKYVSIGTRPKKCLFQGWRNNFKSRIADYSDQMYLLKAEGIGGGHPGCSSSLSHQEAG